MQPNTLTINSAFFSVTIPNNSTLTGQTVADYRCGSFTAESTPRFSCPDTF
ncbi:hypothetical protein RDV39_003698 [Salmonella enterica]|nr:hypothetical protein [Salmonella enterica]